MTEFLVFWPKLQIKERRVFWMTTGRIWMTKNGVNAARTWAASSAARHAQREGRVRWAEFRGNLADHVLNVEEGGHAFFAVSAATAAAARGRYPSSHGGGGRRGRKWHKAASSLSLY